MLKELSIENYALIDRLAIDFTKGLTIITGETGAGKSILLGALGLIAGNRGDLQILQDKARKCVVEAVFTLGNYNLEPFFTTHELDYDAVTTIRREINPEGKSRAFINDTPVTLTVLKELGAHLIDIHSQHETLTLTDSVFQLSVVDAFAGHKLLLTDYTLKHKQFQTLQTELLALIENETQAKKESDYLQFQFDELEAANLHLISQDALENELDTLNHAETIKTALSKASGGLTNGELTVLSSLNEIKSTLSTIAKYNPALEELHQRVDSVYIELKDVANELEGVESTIVYDPIKIAELAAKLDEVYRLQQKHQVKSIAELMLLKDELSSKLLNITTLELQIKQLTATVTAKTQELMDMAKKLSQNRLKVIPAIELQIKKMLQQLGMPNAQLQIEHHQLPTATFNATGIDKINFLFSANKGSDFKQLSKVASGGELSRLMLSLKSLIAQLTALPVIIFDEIDTGVSGEVADKVGGIMKQMGEFLQVIAITHLPQIASKGNSHLFVYKEVKQNKTYSNIKVLDKEQRVLEIAKMLSNETPTAAAINNAKELLSIKSN